jgi:adenosine deaminase
MPLTVCPQSNLRLAVVSDLAEHPIREMLVRGLKATVNSDDPAYFGGYVNDNFFALVDAMGLREDEIFTLVRNGFEAAFLDEAQKRAFLDEVDRYSPSLK